MPPPGLSPPLLAAPGCLVAHSAWGAARLGSCGRGMAPTWSSTSSCSPGAAQRGGAGTEPPLAIGALFACLGALGASLLGLLLQWLLQWVLQLLLCLVADGTLVVEEA